MVKIPGGEFLMGSPEGVGIGDERPQHKVTVPAFTIGKYSVTQAQWEAVMGNNPSYSKGKDFPVVCVNWHDAKKFCERLTQRTGKKYRLPSEAEWEYACRAGTTTKYSFGDDESKLGEFAWFGDNSGSKPHAVGNKKPNPWGLYDMHGNVYEWCEDIWHETYYFAPTDGSAWIDGGDKGKRLLRGGSCLNGTNPCRAAFRGRRAPTGLNDLYGFRLVGWLQ